MSLCLVNREECALSDKVVELQRQQQSGQQEKVLSFNWEFPRHKMLSAQRWTSDFCANATETKDNDAHSCRYAQEVKYAILDGHSNLPETLDAELDQLSWGHSSLLVQLLDSESCTEAKLIEVVKELSKRIEVMEKKQTWSNKEVKYLQGMNEMLLKRIVELKGTVKKIEFKNRSFNPR